STPARRSLPSAPPRSRTRGCRSGSRGSSPVAELVVAFDVPSGREALALARRLPGLRWAKLGPGLYVREGPALAREFLARGVRVVGCEAERLARLAVHAGLRGVVAAGAELPLLRAALGPTPWMVVPGIRSPADPADDQARTIAPQDAVRAGATHLVVGRPI